MILLGFTLLNHTYTNSHITHPHHRDKKMVRKARRDKATEKTGAYQRPTPRTPQYPRETWKSCSLWPCFVPARPSGFFPTKNSQQTRCQRTLSWYTHSLKLTFWHLKIGRVPKRKKKHLPNIWCSGANYVCFRAGSLIFPKKHGGMVHPAVLVRQPIHSLPLGVRQKPHDWHDSKNSPVEQSLSEK